jgi:hypothetical protein
VGLETAYGVALGDAVLYIAYELGFVVVPGWLAYRALAHQPGGPLRQLAMGWALGYVLEVLAFMLTAAIGTRGLFVAYPLVIAAGGIVTIVRRQPATAPVTIDPRPSRTFEWLLASVSLAAVGYIALTYFPLIPLPGARSVTYFQDYPWNISIAAEAKHHWPIQDPSVSGQPLPYHYFVNVHLAASSQVTGLRLPLVFFRLFIIPLVALLVLELVVAGKSFWRSAQAGLIAACLVLFLGQMQLDTRQLFTSRRSFEGVFFSFLISSPSFLFGLVIFVPLLTLLGERLTAAGRGRAGDWILVLLFMVGASDAKITILPLVLAALGLYALWRWLLQRRVTFAVMLAACLTLVVSGTLYILQYKGHTSGLAVDPSAGIDFFNGMPAVWFIKTDLMGALPTFPGKGTMLAAGGVLFGILGLLAPQLVGLVWLSRGRGDQPKAGQAWLFSLFGAGLLALLVLNAPGTGNALYFFFYGLVPGCMLSAEGLRIAWQRRPSLSGRARHAAVLGFGWLMVLLLLMVAPLHFMPFTGPLSEAHTYMFWYGGLLLTLALLYAAARKWIGPTRWFAVALLCAAVAIVGTVGTFVDNLEPSLSSSAAVPKAGKGLTPELYGALAWIRDRTPSDSVIAVNKQFTGLGPFEFDYAAFGERRVFLEGWGYSQRSRELGYAAVAKGLINPFALRLTLNEAAFSHGNRAALEVMVRRYGVRYLVVDRVNGYHADMQVLSHVARTVYRAAGVVVLEVR